jgi:alpha-beta hydrolase superfamily lysophospholipase
MIHSEGNFKGVRNTNIYYQSWVPKDKVKAVLLLVHGLGEHCGRYINLVNHFVPLGYAIYGFDHIGHGRSDGEREFIDSFKDYTDTLNIFHEMVSSWQPDKPTFLLGHSMGGLIATSYLLDHQNGFNGAILSAPAIIASGNISRAAIILGNLLSALTPKLGIVPLDTNALSRDPKVVKAYKNDPLVFKGRTPARLAAEILKTMQHVATEAHRIDLPFLIIQGSADKLVDPSGAQLFYDKASSVDKSIKIYNGLYHELFNEPERADVLKDVEEWLRGRM